MRRRLVALLGRAAPFDAGSDPHLDRALAFVGSPYDAADLRAAALGAGAVSAVGAACSALLPLPGAELAALCLLGVGAGVGVALLAVPRWLARLRRTRALGAVPDLVGLAVLRAHLEPTPEGAAAFAAEHGRGVLADSLREHARRARGGPAAGWSSFGAAWSEWHPTLRRAVSLLQAGVAANPGDRERLLDRALSVALDGTRDRAAKFAAATRGPASGLYAFGVVLPLALVAALPALAAGGVAGLVPLLVVGYDVLLPVALLVASAWLLARRPVAFPPVPVPPDHPDVPDRRGRCLAVAAGAAAASSLWCHVLLAGWTALVVVPGVTVGCALACWFRPVASVRERVAAVEADLPDALVLAGQRLRRGDAVETAVADAGRELAGPTGETFAAAAGVQRRLGVSVRDAFLGEHGVLARVPSPRLRAGVVVLALAGREGVEGGRVLVELAAHLDDLLAVEREARRDLSTLVGTLRSTAWCFGPLVGGATVALAGSVGSGLGDAPPVPVAALGVAVGGYVLALAAILAGLSVALERGFDRALVGYQVGLALAAGSATYGVATLAADVLVHV